MNIKQFKELLEKIDDNGDIMVKIFGDNTMYEVINASYVGKNLYLAVSNRQIYEDLEEILDSLVIEH